MNLHVHSVMFNESLLLPYWLRHYEQFATRIFVWDGGSDDGTRELLLAHPKVTVFDQEKRGLDDLYFTECFMHYQTLSKHADWCMAVACDEFIYHPRLVDKLTELSTSLKVQLSGFVMCSDHPPTTQGQIYEEIQHGHPDIWSRKTVLFRPSTLMQWRPGLHSETGEGRATRHTGIKLLHYRYFGEDYYVERNRRNYERWQVAGIDTQFDMNRRHNLPDGTRGNPYTWYKENRSKLIKII